MKRKIVKGVGFLSLFIIVFTLSLTTCCVGVHGDSMKPTLHDTDLLLVYKTTDIELNDIVVLDSTDLDACIVKRVVGLPGDKLEINKRGFFRNGKEVTEDFIKDSNWVKESIPCSVTVREGAVFVLGDNRVSSYDSRELGAVPTNDIIGTYLLNISDISGLSIYGILLLLVITITFILFFGLSKSSKTK